MNFLLLFLLILALIFESTLTTIPLVFLILLCFTIIYKQNWIFIYGFLFGFLFDLVSFKTIGLSSIYFISFIFLVLLYQRKFEITTYYFVIVASFLGSFGFLLLLGYNNSIIIQSLISSLFSFFIFIILKRFIKLDPNSSKNL